MACFIANTQRTEQTRRSYPLPPLSPHTPCCIQSPGHVLPKISKRHTLPPLTQTILSMSISKRILSYPPPLSPKVISIDQAYPKVTGKVISPQQGSGTRNIVCITPPISLSTSSFPIPKLFLSKLSPYPTLPYPLLLPPPYFPTKQPGPSSPQTTHIFLLSSHSKSTQKGTKMKRAKSRASKTRSAQQ